MAKFDDIFFTILNLSMLNYLRFFNVNPIIEPNNDLIWRFIGANTRKISLVGLPKKYFSIPILKLMRLAYFRKYFSLDL
jgi:hypothetical protein